MAAVQEIDPDIRFEIFTAMPPFIFKESLKGAFACHNAVTDIGLVQKTPLLEDLDETLRKLDRFLPFDPDEVRRLAEKVNASRCQLILCDISPLGIAVARTAGVPSVLMENFTWDWIYEGYLGACPDLARHIDYLKSVFERADYHIQTTPVCNTGTADLVTNPVSRKPRMPASEIRESLHIAQEAKAVLITMGGVPSRYAFPETVQKRDDLLVLMPGTSDAMQRRGNFLLLPHHSGFYHPDLIRASDAVITKTGYSTLAETYHTGLPIGYISREDFRESPVLVRFIQKSMAGLRFSEKDLANGLWVDRIGDLLALSRVAGVAPNGADQAAEFILGLVEKNL